MTARTTTKAVALMSLLAGLGACDKLTQKAPAPDPAATAPVATAPPVVSAPRVPPVGIASAAVNDKVDAAVFETGTPLEKARAHLASGQVWMARLVLEPVAFGEKGGEEELETLASICAKQHDRECIEKCEKKLGRKLKLDAGVVSVVSKEKVDSKTEVKAREGRAASAALRKLLEPKVLSGAATPDEVRMIMDICKAQSDRRCVALCESKLK